MHQGYQFFYFIADDSTDDPPVFYYLAGRRRPSWRFERFSDLVDICGAREGAHCLTPRLHRTPHRRGACGIIKPHSAVRVR